MDNKVGTTVDIGMQVIDAPKGRQENDVFLLGLKDGAREGKLAFGLVSFSIRSECTRGRIPYVHKWVSYIHDVPVW